MSARAQFRLVSLAEGVSFLLLLAVGVPLKHVFGIALASRVLGSLHGALTLFFLISLMRVTSEERWPTRLWLLALLASVLPFGAFVFDARLRRAQ